MGRPRRAGRVRRVAPRARAAHPDPSRPAPHARQLRRDRPHAGGLRGVRGWPRARGEDPIAVDPRTARAGGLGPAAAGVLGVALRGTPDLAPARPAASGARPGARRQDGRPDPPGLRGDRHGDRRDPGARGRRHGDRLLLPRDGLLDRRPPPAARHPRAPGGDAARPHACAGSARPCPAPPGLAPPAGRAAFDRPTGARGSRGAGRNPSRRALARAGVGG